ncbi:MAG: substrate-binding domain-containing protein [Betaproteobacteria bacterium]|nr:substrate-binding domain-containing protein [Betaproteobacteria bacterium]
MTRRLFAAVTVTAAVVTFLVALSKGGLANAAEIKVFSGTGVRTVVSELGRQFEEATGHKLVMQFGVFAVLKRRIDAGETFDVAILNPVLTDELIQVGKVAADTRAILGRSGIGVAVRKGAPKPDISSVEAFTRTMLNAKSVAYSKEGGSGKVLLAGLDRLGIAAEMKPKLKAYGRPEEAVVAGEAELGVTGIGPILAAADAELVGALPPELQSYIVFTAGASAASKEPEAARALIRFLTAPAAAPVMKANGLEPG